MQKVIRPSGLACQEITSIGAQISIFNDISGKTGSGWQLIESEKHRLLNRKGESLSLKFDKGEAIRRMRNAGGWTYEERNTDSR